MGKKVDYILKVTDEKIGSNKVIPKILEEHPVPSELRNMHEEALGAILTEDKLDENSHKLIGTLIKLTYVAGVMEGKNSFMEDTAPKVEMASKLAEKLVADIEKRNSQPKGIGKLGAIFSIKNGLSFGKQKGHNKTNAKRKESNGGK